MDLTPDSIIQIATILFTGGSVWSKVNMVDKKLSKLEETMNQQREHVARIDERLKAIEA